MRVQQNKNANCVCRNSMAACFVTFLLLLPPMLAAQNKFSGILINKLDSTIIPFAALRIPEIDKATLTDAKGAFTFDIPTEINKITLNISAIGCKTTVTYARPYNKAEQVYIDLLPNALNDVAIKGLSAEDVVRKAVASIPANYADSSYFSYSLYRYYEQVNGKFINLIEAEPVVMFRLSKDSKEISANEAFVIKNVRRSRLRPIINGESNKEDLPMIMSENPVYHLSVGALAPHKLSNYSFSFDTGSHSADYVVNYICKDFSSDTHKMLTVIGSFFGESWEKGKLIIDRGSFAIKQCQRTTIRYPEYTYPRNNNFLLPDRKYTAELVDAELEVNYEQVNSKWYVKSIYHRYANDYFTTGPMGGKKAYTINDAFEWESMALSKYTTKDVVDMFAATDPFKKMNFAYDKHFWDEVAFPFHFYSKDSVYHDLERNGPIEEQFYAESKKDGRQ